MFMVKIIISWFIDKVTETQKCTVIWQWWHLGQFPNFLLDTTQPSVVSNGWQNWEEDWHSLSSKNNIFFLELLFIFLLENIMSFSVGDMSITPKLFLLNLVLADKDLLKMAHHPETLHWERQLDTYSIKDLLLEWQAMGLLICRRPLLRNSSN